MPATVNQAGLKNLQACAAEIALGEKFVLTRAITITLLQKERLHKFGNNRICLH